MKVIVFGATGSIGKLVTDELLQHGHEVTAFARNPQALGRSAPNLHNWARDAMDAQSVADAINAMTPSSSL